MTYSVYSTLIANPAETGTIDYNNIYQRFNGLRRIGATLTWPTRYHIADKWENVCPRPW
jgi:hypothetical protein